MVLRWLFIIGSVVLLICLNKVNAQAYFGDGEWAYSGNKFALNKGDAVLIFDGQLNLVDTIRLPKQFVPTEYVQLFFSDISWNPSDTTIAVTVFAETNETINQQTLLYDLLLSDYVLDLGYQSSPPIAWDNTGQYIAFVVPNSVVKVFDTQSLQTIAELEMETTVSAIQWNPTNMLQVVIVNAESATIINVFGNEIVSVLPARQDPLFITYSQDGLNLALYSNQTVDIYNMSTMNRESSTNVPKGINVKNIYWSSLGLMLMDFEGSIYRLNEQGVFDLLYSLPSTTRNIYWKSDGSAFAVNNGGIELWDAVDNRILEAVNGHGEKRSMVLDLLQKQHVLENESEVVLSSQPLEALINSTPVRSVHFSLNDIITIDNEAPYSIPLPSIGTYTLTVTPYSLPDAQGDAGIPFTVNFTVVDGE